MTGRGGADNQQDDLLEPFRLDNTPLAATPAAGRNGAGAATDDDHEPDHAGGNGNGKGKGNRFVPRSPEAARARSPWVRRIAFGGAAVVILAVLVVGGLT